MLTEILTLTVLASRTNITLVEDDDDFMSDFILCLTIKSRCSQLTTCSLIPTKPSSEQNLRGELDTSNHQVASVSIDRRTPVSHLLPPLPNPPKQEHLRTSDLSITATLPCAGISTAMTNSKTPATVPAPALTVGTQALTGAVMCAVSFAASAQPMRIELPKISLPKLPDINIDLPKFGKKKKPAASTPTPTRIPRMDPSKVKVRPAKGVVASGTSVDAPTLAEVTGQTSQDTIDVGEGYKRFPERRMPGANMDSWKKIAKDINPGV